MLVTIKNQSSDGKIPRGLLMNGSPAIRATLNDFQIARYLDMPNERYPVGKQTTPINRAFYLTGNR